jgi:hypothetical protein
VLRPIKTREEIMKINPSIALQTQGESKEEVFEAPYVTYPLTSANAIEVKPSGNTLVTPF